jgi:DNA-binding CsgD family transcriptional regulator
MNLWERLLFLLGVQRRTETRLFALDEHLHSVLVDLAEQERRPAEEIQADLLVNALTQRHENDDLWKIWQLLTPREQQVSAMACLGYTNRQMAARLGVAEETVKTHVKNALVKFDLHGKGELRMLLRDWDFSKWE